MTADTLDTLTALGACDDACEWVRDKPDQTPAALWASCPRGDWMAWYLGRLAARAGQGSPEHRRATLVSVLCARTATPHAGQWREEIEALLAQIEEWAHGDAGVDLGAVWGRLWTIRSSAAYAAYASSSAADAAAYAADVYASSSAADAAAAAYAAADAYAYAATDVYAADAAARRAHLADLADMIRDAVPVVPLPGGDR